MESEYIKKLANSTSGGKKVYRYYKYVSGKDGGLVKQRVSKNEYTQSLSQSNTRKSPSPKKKVKSPKKKVKSPKKKSKSSSDSYRTASEGYSSAASSKNGSSSWGISSSSSWELERGSPIKRTMSPKKRLEVINLIREKQGLPLLSERQYIIRELRKSQGLPRMEKRKHRSDY